MTITETCSCSASVSVPVESASYYQAAANIVAEWRKEHRHEFPPAEPMPDEHPTIVESGSSHERALTFGFAPEPEGGWHERMRTVP